MSCHRQTLGGMVYYCYCKTCKEMVHPQGVEETNSFYYGRCARCLYTRQKEHTAGLAAEKEENPLWKHKELHHQDEEPEFVFTAEKFFKDTLSHQLYEGVCINNSPSSPGMLMNSRAEYEQGGVARVVVARGL